MLLETNSSCVVTETQKLIKIYKTRLFFAIDSGQWEDCISIVGIIKRLEEHIFIFTSSPEKP
jgi:hypothetical protein